MNLTDIQNETHANKQHYWAWLKDINAKQAEVLLDFAKDAFEQEAKRGEQIDTKGNWLLGASFAALSLATIVAPPAVRGLDPPFHAIVLAAITVVIVSLVFAMVMILWTIRVSRSWFPPNPSLIMRQAIITDNEVDLERDLALHYFDNVSLNRHVDNTKAQLLKRGQGAFFIAMLGVAIVGLCRMLA